MSTPSTPDRELRVLQSMTRRIPPLPRASAVVNRGVKPWYLRRQRDETVADVRGFSMRLDPQEAIDAMYLFAPQLYDRHELAFLARELSSGEAFADVGAHLGLYSLVAGRVVGGTGRVVAVEPHPATFKRLQWNLEANGMPWICPLNVAAGGASRQGSLRAQARGNAGGTSVVSTPGEGPPVETVPLQEILERCGVASLAGLKLDIEGMENEVLERYFADVAHAARPRLMLVEGQGGGRDDVLLGLLHETGYAVRERRFSNAWNYILVKDR